MQRFSTCNATMLYCKLKKNVARITGPLRQDDNARRGLNRLIRPT